VVPRREALHHLEGTSEIQRLVIGRALRADANTDPLDQRMEAPR
jgi:hypothetical protein